MYIYLPIAEMPVNIFLIFSLGGITGILAGMFGVGGGFLMTPFLIFMGVPPAVAVSSSANQIIAASFSGFLAHLRRQNVDIKMGMVMLSGGIIGSSLGVWVFSILTRLGQIDLAISVSYVLFLGSIGSFMGWESFRVIYYKRKGITPPRKEGESRLLRFSTSLPWQMDFPHSGIRVSAMLPIAIGILVGMMVSIMGIGGGFVMIPAMIYLLGMPTSVVIGTSLFQIVFITCNVTLLQSINTHTVDIILSLLMLTSSVIGAQIGSKLGHKLPAEQLRAWLAVMVMGVVLKLAYGLFVTPENPYTILALIP